MPVDFDTLVLSPTLAIFGREIEIDPITSRPGEIPYRANGVFVSEHVDYQLQDGSVLSDQNTSLGIRISEFGGRPPLKRDLVTVLGPQDSYYGAVYWIADVDMDGEGRRKLRLRKVEPLEIAP